MIKKSRHSIDEKSLSYGSELGCWYGKCKDCGINLIIYTGSYDSKPKGSVYYHTKIKTMGTDHLPKGTKIINFSFDEFMEGKPNCEIS